MATEIPGTVIASLAAKLDTLELTEEERIALGVVLAAGLESGRERPEVEGFMPTAVEFPSGAPFGSQLNLNELENFSFTFGKISVTNLSAGGSTSDDVSGGH